MNIIELGIPFIKQAYRVKSEDRKVNSMIENEHITNVPSDMRTRKEMGPIEK